VHGYAEAVADEDYFQRLAQQPPRNLRSSRAVGALAGVAATFVALALMAMVPNGIFAIAVLLVMAVAGVYLYGTSAHKSLRGGMGAALLVALAALSFLALIGPLVGFVDDGSAQSRTDDLIMG